MRRLSGPSIAAGASRSQRWLRADLGDVVRVEPGGDGVASVPSAELNAGLDRWAGRLSRSRAYVVTRRWLLVALLVALIPAIVLLATGASRPWWLIAAVLIGPLAGVIVLLRRPTPARTARVLDSDLELSDRLTTGLELQAAGGSPSGLGGLVVAEASSALGQSLTGARAITRRSPREFAWLLAAAVALVVVIALPRSGSSAPHAARASTGPGAVAGGGAGAASPTHPGAPGPVNQTTIPSATPLPPPRISKQTFGDGRRHYNPTADPYAGGYKGGHFDPKQQAAKPTAGASGLGLADPGSAAAQKAAQQAAQAAAAGAAAHGSSSSGHAPVPGGAAGQKSAGAPSLSAAAGQRGNGAQSGAGAGAGGGPGGAAAGKSAGAGASPTSAGAHGTSSGTQSGSGGSSGGETAGGVKATQSHGVGLVPALGGSKSALPLQAGLAGSRAGRSGAQGAISRTGNGGGGYARGVQAGSAAGVGGAGVNLPVLAPTFNSSAQPESGLLARYFGAANRLAFRAW